MTPKFADLQAQLQPPLDQAVLRAVDRAAAELRRGDPVLLEAPDGAVLAASVEGLTAERLDRLVRFSNRPPVLIMTATRAAALGLPAVRDVAVLTALGTLDPDRVLALVDPDREAGEAVDGLSVTGGKRHGLEDAAVQLVKLARLLPAAVAVSLPAGDMAAMAADHDLVRVQVQDVLDYQTHAARTLTLVSEARIPLADAENARVLAFRPSDGGVEHLAIVIGEPDPAKPVLTRIHSECFTGDLLGSLRCDCGDQLRGAIREIARQGSGVVLYLAQEGRGIGLVNKLRAYRLQDQGFDTVDANERLGFEADERIYLPAAEILRQLGFQAVRLLTNNPDKLRQLARCGIQVAERVPHVFPSNGHNESYLRTKAERSGHLF